MYPVYILQARAVSETNGGRDAEGASLPGGHRTHQRRNKSSSGLSDASASTKTTGRNNRREDGEGQRAPSAPPKAPAADARGDAKEAPPLRGAGAPAAGDALPLPQVSPPPASGPGPNRGAGPRSGRQAGSPMTGPPTEPGGPPGAGRPLPGWGRSALERPKGRATFRDAPRGALWSLVPMGVEWMVFFVNDERIEKTNSAGRWRSFEFESARRLKGRQGRNTRSAAAGRTPESELLLHYIALSDTIYRRCLPGTKIPQVFPLLEFLVSRSRPRSTVRLALFHPQFPHPCPILCSIKKRDTCSLFDWIKYR